MDRKKAAKYKNRMSLKVIDDIEVLVYNNDCLVKPGADMQSHIVQWYHYYLKHPGHFHLEETLSSVMWWSNMYGHI